MLLQYGQKHKRRSTPGLRSSAQLYAVSSGLTEKDRVLVDGLRKERVKPVLELDRYFNGTIDGWGMVQERSGKAIRRFHVVIDAKWNGATGTLDESFEWSDCVKEKRVWTITKGGPASSTEVFSIYAYKQAFVYLNFDMIFKCISNSLLLPLWSAALPPQQF